MDFASMFGGTSSADVIDDMLDLVSDQVDGLMDDLAALADDLSTTISDVSSGIQDELNDFSSFKSAYEQQLVQLQQEAVTAGWQSIYQMQQDTEFLRGEAVRRVLQQEQFASMEMQKIANDFDSDTSKMLEDLSNLFLDRKTLIDSLTISASQSIIKDAESVSGLAGQASLEITNSTQDYQELLQLDRFENELLSMSLRNDFLSEKLNIGAASLFTDKVINAKQMDWTKYIDIIAIAASAMFISPMAGLLASYSLIFRPKIHSNDNVDFGNSRGLITSADSYVPISTTTTTPRMSNTILESGSDYDFLTDFGDIGISDFNLWDDEITDYTVSDVDEVWNYFHNMASNTLISDTSEISLRIDNTVVHNSVGYPNYELEVI